MVCGLEQAWEAYVATFKDWQPDAGEAGGAATEAAPDTAEAHQAQETEKGVEVSGRTAHVQQQGW